MSVMKREIQEKLLALNREFYERFGASFSASRFGPQPGWDRIIPYFPRRCAVLDLGCGNGRFALFLDRHLEQVRYVGLEGSETLLRIAREQTAGLQHVQATLIPTDLTTSDWAVGFHEFDVVVALAVVHHIPGFAARAAFVRQAAWCMKPEGVLILSTWRFTHNARMRRKLLPWATIGLSEADIEPGDYLLDWKREDVRGVRYAHELDQEEVSRLAALAGLRVVEQFVADGREGDLSLYSILKRG
ncbi:MAG TPA: class I SAM-dependent methyltransferase [Anaerolineae bacterium]|nr:class I SAM-dependent methyltransferase [Anaerolineae bacterium]